MKGLLIKDLKLLKNQRTFFLIVAFICLLFVYTGTDVSFVVSYVTIMFSIIAVSSISYDEQENGWSYLFTLPINRERYVTEKYVFGLILTIGAWMFTSVVSYIVSFYRYTGEIFLNEWCGIMNLCLGTVILVLAIAIPIQLKFGAERSRMAYMVIFGSIMAIIFLLSKVFKIKNIGLDEWVTRFGNTQPVMFAGMIAGICMVVVFISWFISVKIIKTKEF